MKKNLGKIFLIFLLLLSVELFASTYKWSAEISKNTAYVNEAIHLKYTCEFSDKSELYTIDFNPLRDNEKYSLKLLAESEKILNNKRVNIYEFVVFVKEQGRMTFDFNMTMKKTTQDSIDSTIGGRDNDREKEEFSQRVMRQKSLSVDVKEAQSLLVGKFILDVKMDAPQVKAYEPYHMEIKIDGLGNMDAITEYIFEIAGVKVFSNKPIMDVKLTKDGYSGTWSQKFAFVSDVDFVVPEISFQYLNINERIIENLKVEAITIKTTKAFVKEELLDVEEEKFRFSYEYLYYCLTFIAGFLVANIKLKSRNKKESIDKIFLQKVADSNSLDELAIVLALQDSKKYDEIILKIEMQEGDSLKNLKKELLN